MTGIASRPPTGKVPYPLILVEGGEKSGKSWMAAVLTGSPKVGKAFWLDLGEGAGDEYGAIAESDYQVLIHDGQWATIFGQVEAVKAEAERASKAGESPVVLVIDTATAEWDMLKDWASSRAAKSNTNRAKLRDDPNAEIIVSTNFWNDAGARHRKLMTLLLTFPGIVVMTARGKETVKMENGRPVEGQRSYSVEGHKTLAFDATVWLRLSRDASPIIVGCRSVHAGIKPGKDKPKEIEDKPNLLEWLIFDVLKVDPVTSHVRDLPPLSGEKLTPDEREEIEPQAIAAEKRERMRIIALIRIAGRALTLDTDDKLAADYRIRNNAEMHTASNDDLASWLKDLEDEVRLKSQDTQGVPA